MSLDLVEKLSKVFDRSAAHEVSQILLSNNLRLIISNARTTKHGDFRPSTNGSRHRISINGNLGKDSALLVFLHEFAHLIVYQKHQKRVAPHGNEWKSIFSHYIQNFVAKGHFSQYLKDDLIGFSQNIKSTGLGYGELARKLGAEGPSGEKSTGIIYYVEDLPEDSIFVTRSGRVFRKGKLLRKRYLCLCLTTNKRYVFNPLAEVMPRQMSQKK